MRIGLTPNNSMVIHWLIVTSLFLCCGDLVMHLLSGLLRGALKLGHMYQLLKSFSTQKL